MVGEEIEESVKAGGWGQRGRGCIHCTCGRISPGSGRDCAKSLRSCYTGLYPQRGWGRRVVGDDERDVVLRHDPLQPKQLTSVVGECRMWRYPGIQGTYPWPDPRIPVLLTFGSVDCRMPSGSVMILLVDVTMKSHSAYAYMGRLPTVGCEQNVRRSQMSSLGGHIALFCGRVFE